MSKINKYGDFIKTNEEINISMDSFKGLLNKVKSIIPKSKIDSFIRNNKEEVERVKNMITNGDGEIDYQKAFDLVKKEIKK